MSFDDMPGFGRPATGAGEIGRLPAGYLSKFFLASFKAASGVASPFVAVSKAAFIELQSLPI